MAKSIGWYVSELKRRKVYRVAAVYAIVAFGVWQVADIAFPGLGLPDTAVTVVLLFTILGFPIAMVLAWAYEVRPETDTAEDEAGGSREPSEGTADTTGTPASISPAGASIAVLPFENMSTESEGDFFADGITEEITHILAQSPGMRVVARTSAFAFKGQAADIRDVATKLGVTHVLEGSVRRAGNELRITVQLIDASAGYHIWSERYDRETGDVFAVQDEIAGRVASQLSSDLPADATVSGLAAAPVSRSASPTNSMAAYDAYLRGRQLRARFDPRSLASAIERFEEALGHDPDFAPAHAALAESYSAQAIGMGLASHDTMPRARAAADRALDLEPGLADAHVARALVAMFYERDYTAAKKGLDRALALNPNYAEAYVWSEFYWTYIARVFESAVAASQRAQQLSPLDPSIAMRLGVVYYLFGRFDEAHAYLTDLLAQAPDAPITLMSLADTLLRMGRIEEGLSYANRALKIVGEEAAPGAPMGVTGSMRALAGDLDGARQLLSELERRAGVGFVTSFWQAVIHAALGDHDRAFRLLDQAYDEGDCNLLYVYAAPREFGLRDDPRMAVLLERLNLSAW